MLFLIPLAFLLYAVKRKVWADLHCPEADRERKRPLPVTEAGVYMSTKPISYMQTRVDSGSVFVHGAFMTDMHRKPTRLELDLPRQPPARIDFYIRKLAELTEIGLKQAEQLAAQLRGNADALGTGTKAAAEPPLTLDEMSLEYERITRAVLLSIMLSSKLYDERLARDRQATGGAVVMRRLDPRLERQVKEAIAQLAEPYKSTTRH